MYGYLRGYLIGVPAMILLQILGPILVLDNEKKLFTASSAVLSCCVDVAFNSSEVIVDLSFSVTFPRYISGDFHALNKTAKRI